MPEKIPCSVLILTRNSGATLERCLHNLERFGEILVHDANSEDDSVAIARRYGARVLPQYDTNEKSVRVKDFTELRLRQRAAASYDWVLYLDSDEELSDGAVEEVAEMLRSADPKTIIKFPRFSVREGRVRRYGLYCPEIMPRIHNRTSGCTLRASKIVHEKYVYDASFRVITARNPLYVPLDDLQVLHAKDAQYLRLEYQRIERQGYSWAQYVRWVLLREPLVVASLLLRMLRVGPRYMRSDAMPIRYDVRYVRYHVLLFWTLTKAMLRHPGDRGRERS